MHIKPILIVCLLFVYSVAIGQKEVVISNDLFGDEEQIVLDDYNGWIFRAGNDAKWAEVNIDISGWEQFKPSQLSVNNADENGKVEGWFRLKLRLDSTVVDRPLFWYKTSFEAVDLFIDGALVHSYGSTKGDANGYEPYLNLNALPIPAELIPSKEHLIAVHFVESTFLFPKRLKSKLSGPWTFLSITGQDRYTRFQDEKREALLSKAIVLSLCMVLSCFFWILVWQNPKERTLLLIAVFSSAFTLALLAGIFAGEQASFYSWWIYFALFILLIFATMGILPLVVSQIFIQKVSKNLKLIFVGQVIFGILNISIIWDKVPLLISAVICFSICGYFIFAYWKSLRGAQWAIVGGIVLMLILLIATLLSLILEISLPAVSQIFGLPLPLSMLFYVSIRFREMLTEVENNSDKVIKISEEKRIILENQKDTLEEQVKTRTRELSLSLENLRATQSQLIHAEKMASLGELTAGIAHEIQNPLNFVNNFSEVSKELIEEMEAERLKVKGERDESLEGEILKDLNQNLQKIYHHGQRASSIVKGMLEHSRTGDGKKEPTDINALADEYLRLAYHGMRAKDKSFNADFKTEFDETLPKINVVPQDIGRVLLNLINNAFYAVDKKAARHSDPERSEGEESEDYKPLVIVSTKKLDNKIELSVKDNGSGIPSEIKDKIFQPFFTTKPTGSGTGLGLSLSYDIVKAHGGEIKLLNIEGGGTEFTITLPLKE